MTRNYKSLLMGMAFTAMLTGCADTVNDLGTSGNELSDVTLQLAVKGVKPSTRTIIEGSEFPNDSTFTIFAMRGGSNEYISGGSNVSVTYTSSGCDMDRPIAIPFNTDVPVYAFYPEIRNSDVNKIEISANSQEDYLWGRSVDPNDMLSYATTKNPKVNISFEHIMARITLRIRRAEDNKNAYEIPHITLGGDNEYSYRTAIVSAKNRTITNQSYGNYEDIIGEVSGIKIHDDIPVITADFLVIPSKTNWDIHLTDAPNLPWWNPLPVESYESGYQYIYDVVIANPKGNEDEALLQITQCDIIPWENNQMPEVETY